MTCTKLYLVGIAAGPVRHKLLARAVALKGFGP